MAIPKMTDDLNIIQALSDLPNAEDGLTAEELKQRFDQAGLLIQDYLNNKLIDAIQASEIPFSPTEAVNADTVQSAVEAVQLQIKEAATGAIIDGSITKEKLSEELLDRTYGGLTWISIETPGSGENPDTDFPQGQQWLRPGYTLTNLLNQWTCDGCTMEQTDTGWAMTSTGVKSQITASQSLSAVGQAGQKVLVYLKVAEGDSRMLSLELYLNDQTYEMSTGSGGLIETTLDQTGSLTIQLAGLLPFAFSGASVKLTHTAAVNVQALEAELPGVSMPEDWEQFLTGQMPFTTRVLEQTLYQQTSPGVWSVVDQPVLPVSRGGTGVKALEAGAFLKGEEDGSLGFISQEALFALFPSLEITTGTYTGTGAARTVTLPVIPKLLLVYPQSGPTWKYNNTDYVAEDNPAILADGCSRVEVWRNTAGAKYSVQVSLSGESLTMAKLAGTVGGADLCNRSGVAYSWIAIS